MERLIRLIKKRKEIGKRLAHKKGGNFNDLIQYKSIGDLILEEVNRLYDEGKLGE